MFFAAISNYCVGEVSAYPKQEFSPDIDDPDDGSWKAVAKANG